MRRNVAANRSAHAGALRCRSYTWGRTLPRELRARWDLIVGCDIVYDRNAVSALADTLSSLLDRGSAAEATEAVAGGVGGGRSGGRTTQVLLALPDRTDFGYHRRGPDGVLSATLPDYELLLADLERRLPNRLEVVLLDSIETADHVACGTSIHVLRLSCRPRAAAAVPEVSCRVPAVLVEMRPEESLCGGTGR